MAAPKQAATNWHATTAAHAAEQLGSDPKTGLTPQEAELRRTQCGANRLVRRTPEPGWKLFLEQFRSLLILVLLGAAVLAAAVGNLKDALVILAVVVVNATLGYRQEHRAEAAVAALKRMLVGTARVRRGGNSEIVDVEQLVPGDIVLLEAGDRVPADGRLVHGRQVEVDESVITGESHPVEKRADDVLRGDIPLAERSNFAFMNTVVTRGRLELLITETGMGTQIGKIAGMLEGAEPTHTPLQIELDRLGKRLALIAIVVVSLVLAVDLRRGEPLVKELMDAIALAVAAIPEGLPAVVTITLALGMQRMAQSHAIVKKLAAVETLGCTTVIGSDKTGTLTMNRMTVRAAWFRGQRFIVEGSSYASDGSISAQTGDEASLEALALPAALCNDAELRDGTLVGDPTEGALLGFALKAGVEPRRAAERLPRVDEVPFDSATKLMATFHRDAEIVRVFVKGAPDALLAQSISVLADSGLVDLNEQWQERIRKETDAMAERGMRVLAVAERTVDPTALGSAPATQWVSDLTLLGLIGIVDPPRPGAADSVAQCRRASIDVKMITGDHKATALAIASEIGVSGGALCGPELDALDDEELRARVRDVGVFARVSPAHKLRIVRALQAEGNVVAMTGDGVNDAPAVKAADIGIAMGLTGTEVTKEAATMVLADDDFSSIVGAVREGRTIYDNIVKFVRFQLSTNIGAVLTVAGATLMGLPSPFTAVQLLWINIIMDGPPAMTLGLDPARPGIMDDPPRTRTEPILSLRRFAGLFAFGSIMAAGTLLALELGTNAGGTRYGLTLAFTTFVCFQIFNAFNARAERHTILSRSSLDNWRLWAALVGIALLQVLLVSWPPARHLFGTVALSAHGWSIAVGIASSVVVLEELRKLVVNALHRVRHRPRRVAHS